MGEYQETRLPSGWRSRGHYAPNTAVLLFGDLPVVGPLLWWAFAAWQRLM